MIKFADILCKILRCMAPPMAPSPLNEFIRQNHNSSITATTRVDVKYHIEEVLFWQSAFSFRAAHTWNTIPTELRKITYFIYFSAPIKQWLLLDNQTGLHNLK